MELEAGNSRSRRVGGFFKLFLRKNLIFFPRVVFIPLELGEALERRGRKRRKRRKNLGDSSQKNRGKSGRGFAKTLREHRPENIKLMGQKKNLFFF